MMIEVYSSHESKLAALLLESVAVDRLIDECERFLTNPHMPEALKAQKRINLESYLTLAAKIARAVAVLREQLLDEAAAGVEKL